MLLSFQNIDPKKERLTNSNKVTFGGGRKVTENMTKKISYDINMYTTIRNIVWLDSFFCFFNHLCDMATNIVVLELNLYT